LSASKHRLYFLLQRAAHGLKKEADAALKTAAGLTTAQAAVMSIIVGEGAVSQRKIAQMLLQQESAITAMAERLLKAGYITKTRSATDARAVELEATDAGRAALAEIRPSFQAVNALLDESFSPNDIARLAAGLKRVIDRLDAG
jgi:MarR family transcriptional regulator, organic hydroperoxide resistance regulator